MHFSEVDLERRNLSASNYNKQPVAFKSAPSAIAEVPAKSPEPVRTQSLPATNTSQFIPAPLSKPAAPVRPSGSVTQVARPKFRATSAKTRLATYTPLCFFYAFFLTWCLFLTRCFFDRNLKTDCQKKAQGVYTVANTIYFSIFVTSVFGVCTVCFQMLSTFLG